MDPKHASPHLPRSGGMSGLYSTSATCTIEAKMRMTMERMRASTISDETERQMVSRKMRTRDDLAASLKIRIMRTCHVARRDGDEGWVSARGGGMACPARGGRGIRDSAVARVRARRKEEEATHELE